MEGHEVLGPFFPFLEYSTQTIVESCSIKQEAVASR